MTSGLLIPESGIEIIRGTTRTLELSVMDLDGKPVDITGSKIIMSVKSDVTDAMPVLQKTSDNANQAKLTVPKHGNAEIYIKPADTQNLDSTIDYVFDVWVVMDNGDRFAVIPPTLFRVKDTVTKIPLT